MSFALFGRFWVARYKGGRRGAEVLSLSFNFSEFASVSLLSFLSRSYMKNVVLSDSIFVPILRVVVTCKMSVLSKCYLNASLKIMIYCGLRLYNDIIISIKIFSSMNETVGQRCRKLFKSLRLITKLNMIYCGA